jgi:ribonuclease P protein component
VVRNRIRRRLYEVVRHHEQQIAHPYDIVLSVFTETVASLPAEDIERAVLAQLRQAKIIE